MVQKGAPLSPRELEIAELVTKGASNKEIARELFISVNTAKVHLKNIFAKLDVQSRTELAMRAVEEGWVDAGQRVERLERSVPLVYRTLVALFGVALTLIFLLVLPRVRSPASETTMPSLETDRWSDLAPMSTARSRLAVVAHEGLIYALGGETANGVTGLLEIYDPVSDTWKTASPKPTPARDISGTVLQGKIYLPGGCTEAGDALSIMEVYDPRSDSWEGATPLPKALCAYALAAWEGKLYLFGGWDGTSYSAAVYRYDPDTDLWQMGTSLSKPRGYVAAVATGDQIYVVGGYDGEEILKTVEEYDPISEANGIDPWRARADMSMARASLGVVALGGNLYAIGGGWDRAPDYNERYDPQLDSWSPFEASTLNPWGDSGVAALDTRVYLFGGWNGDHLAASKAYRALFRTFIPAVESAGTPPDCAP